MSRQFYKVMVRAEVWSEASFEAQLGKCLLPGSLAHWVIVGSFLPLVGVVTNTEVSHRLACQAASVYRSLPFSSMTASLTKEGKPRKQLESLYRGQIIVFYELDMMSHLAICAAFCGLKVSQRQRKMMTMVICKDERGKQRLHPLTPLQGSHEEEASSRRQW